MKLAQNNLDQYSLGLSSNTLFWEEFHAELVKHTANVQILNEWAQSTMPSLHQQLLSDDQYLNALDKAENESFESHNFSLRIFEDNFIRINLIAIEPGKSLPLHDHPKSAGIALVISGEAEITICEKPEEAKFTALHLNVIDHKMISTGDTSCFTEKHHNIHGMKSVSERCVLLIIHTSPFAISSQSFFFPSPPQQQPGTQMLAQCFRAEAILNLRNNKGCTNTKRRIK